MAANDFKFAQKVSSFAPLTDAADSFSPHDRAKPDFKTGEVVVANYQFAQNQRLKGFRPSYTQKSMPQQGQPE